MPKFQLPMGLSAPQFASQDAFCQGYIEAMFFTDCTPDHEDTKDCTVSDLAPGTWDQIIADCRNFQNKAASALSEAYERDYDEAQAGRDYWLTRNGHGVGFWDRDQLGKELGERLSAMCRYSEKTLYKGDDGKLYLM